MTQPEVPTPSEHGREPAESAASLDHAASHMDEHATLSDDDHGHAEPRLGPIDWAMWAYAAVGVAAGALVVLFFWLAIG